MMDESRIRYLPYNRSNKDRARENRKSITKAEELAREVLRKKKLGYIFLRQKLMDSFILDFYCAKLLLAIELDGKIHLKTAQYDLERDTKLHKKGIEVIRYHNEDIIDHIEERKEDIKNEIKKREKERGINN